MSIEALSHLAHRQRVLESFGDTAQRHELISEDDLARMRSLIERYEKTLEVIASSDPDYDALHMISLAQSALEAERSMRR